MTTLMMIQITEMMLVIKMILVNATMMMMLTRHKIIIVSIKDNKIHDEMTVIIIQDCRDNIGD